MTSASSLAARLTLARDLAQALLGSLVTTELAEVALVHLARLVQSDGAAVVATTEDGAIEHLAGSALSDVAALTPEALDQAARGIGAEHALSTELRARGSQLGAVLIWRTRADDAFHDDDRAALDEIAGPLSLALENARLHRALSTSFDSLRAAQIELVRRERLAALGTMAAVLAHEVRTPLAVLFNAVSSLNRLGVTSSHPDAEVLLRIVDEEAHRLERLVNDLLEFGRTRSRTFSEVDVATLVSDATESVKRDPSLASSVSLLVDPHGPAGAAVWDIHGVRQAVQNLILNAAQAVGGGPGAGEVRVSVELVGDERVRIAVADDGPGIPAPIRRRMFDPFVTTRPRGVGLGLAIVRRVVDDHLGDLVVRTERGRGTRIELVLPRRPQMA